MTRLDFGEDLAATYAARLSDAQTRVPRDPGAPLTEAAIAHLPAPMQRWLRRSGAVGQPPLRCLHIVYDATMHQRPGGKGIAGTAEQFDTVVAPMRRLFYMPAKMFGVPMAVLHDYDAGEASMQVRVARVLEVADEHGEALARTETVTLLNDLAFWAPSSLVGPACAWRAIDDRRSEVSFVLGPHAVRAALVVDDAGDLVDFRSDDRGRVQKDGTFRLEPWSTPMRSHRAVGSRRVPWEGDAIWHTAEGDFVYGRFVVRSITFDLEAPLQQDARADPSAAPGTQPTRAAASSPPHGSA